MHHRALVRKPLKTAWLNPTRGSTIVRLTIRSREWRMQSVRAARGDAVTPGADRARDTRLRVDASTAPCNRGPALFSETWPAVNIAPTNQIEQSFCGRPEADSYQLFERCANHVSVVQAAV
jgi:hypothetical protein